MPSAKDRIKKYILVTVLSIVFFDSLSLSLVAKQLSTISNEQPLFREELPSTDPSNDTSKTPITNLILSTYDTDTIPTLTKTTSSKPSDTKNGLVNNNDDDDDDEEPSAKLNKSCSMSNSDDHDNAIENYLLYIKELVKRSQASEEW